jgi:hypothetical protein
MKTLAELMAEYGADGYVLADKGNGSAFGLDGQSVRVDLEDLDLEDLEPKLGRIKMRELAKPHISGDGVECHFASKWQVSADGYKYRFYF